jgi:TetR/AcrR family transcriptional regulator, transcriptional repressor of bet genes
MPGKKLPEDQRREQILEAAYRVALRQRIAGLSSRAVASEAGISHGLLFFHFRNRRELMLALLDWLLAQKTLRRAEDRGKASGDASSRLADEIRSAIEGLPRDSKRIELFFDYWFMGEHDPMIRNRIRAALKVYRDSYLPWVRALIKEHPEEYRGVSAEAMADIVTSFIEGCSMRAITDPHSYDAPAYSGAIKALLTRRRAGSFWDNVNQHYVD